MNSEEKIGDNQSQVKTNNSDPMSDTKKRNFFSADPAKAKAEKFFVWWTPIWLGIQVISGVLWRLFLPLGAALNDLTLLITPLLSSVPLFVIPLIFKKQFTGDKKWYETYWFKANVYITIYTFFGTYFGTEYFFDVLGMNYNYPFITWYFDSALVGTGQQSVPVIMYFTTIAYFTTYHSIANLMLRPARNAAATKRWAKKLFPLAVFSVSYFFAFMETFLMANPATADTFSYDNLPMMLIFGSIIYGLEFVVSFPAYFFIDENPQKPWSLKKVVSVAFATSMYTILMLDIFAHFLVLS